MRSLQRQLQDVWVCSFKEIHDGLDTIKEYGKPEKHRFSVSATSGTIWGWGAGLSLSYDRYITSFDRNFKAVEGMMAFIDVVPEFDDDGNLKQVEKYEYELDGSISLDDDGNPITYMEYATEPDYMIKRIHDTQRGRIAKYGIQKV